MTMKVARRQIHGEETSILGKRRTASGSGLGFYRWFVERTISSFKQFQHSRIRYEHDPAMYFGFFATCSCVSSLTE